MFKRLQLNKTDHMHRKLDEQTNADPVNKNTIHFLHAHIEYNPQTKMSVV